MVSIMKNIYILEDETGIRDALQLLLSFENYEVRSFSTIEAFHERNKNEVPDLFILDVMMPDGLGTTVCNQLKSDESTAHIPVMIMSAHAKNADVVKACNADIFVSKPFDIDEVIEIIENLTKEVKA